MEKLKFGYLLLGLSLFVMPQGQCNLDKYQMNIQGTDISNRQQMLKDLVVEHGILLNKAILGFLNNDSPEKIEQIKQQLLGNANKIAMLISAGFGQQAGQQFEKLFVEHIQLGADYIVAVKQNNSAEAKRVADKALQNGQMIGQFLSRLFPSIEGQIWDQLLKHHVQLEADQTNAYFRGDHKKGEELKQQSLTQLAEIADTVFKALKNQFHQN